MRSLLCWFLLISLAPFARADTPLEPGVDGTTFPERTKHVSPRYPPLARERNACGSVILEAVVRKDGTVGDVALVRADAPGHGLEQAALDAVAQWRYKPGMKDGEPVDVVFMVVVEYILRGSVNCAAPPADFDFETDFWQARKSRKAGDLDEAMERAQAALVAAESFSKWDSRLFLAERLAADLRAERGENDEALFLYQRSLEHGKKLYGKKSLDLMETRGRLAALQVEQEHYFDAEVLIEETVRILEKKKKHRDALAWWLERHRQLLVSMRRLDDAAKVADRIEALQAGQ